MTRSLLTFVVVLLCSLAARAQDDVRVIVVFNGNPDGAAVTGAGGHVLFAIQASKALVARIPPAKVAVLQAHPNVSLVEEDGDVVALGQTVPYNIADNSYGAGVRADQVWSVTRGAGVNVAVIDTGILDTHPDLAAGTTLKKTYVTGTKSARDDNGHGTHVAGTIGARDNSEGVIGVAPACNLWAYKALDRGGRGYVSAIVAAINDAVADGAHVINMSLGSNTYSATLEDACNSAVGAGLVVCAAAGNDGKNVKTYPGALDSVICVAATTDKAVRSYFSNYGDWVDVAGPGGDGSQPGVDIYSTYLKNSYKYLSGTSMATPHVSGLAALLIASGLLADRDGLNGIGNEVRQRIEQSAGNGSGTKDIYVGYGLIDAQQAIQMGPN